MAQMKEIDVLTAFEKAQNGVLLVDVREADEVRELAYEVKNILHIPLSVFQERYTEIPKNQEVIMVCRSGGRSGKATEALLQIGFENVCNMKGGILAWAENELPLIKG